MRQYYTVGRPEVWGRKTDSAGTPVLEHQAAQGHRKKEKVNIALLFRFVL
jgi:hypothetical protein